MKKFLTILIILGAVGLVGTHQLFASSISVSDTTASANAAQGVHYNGFELANSQGTQEGIAVVDGYTNQNVTANSISFLVNVGSDYTGNFSFSLGVTPDGGTQQSYPLSTMSTNHYSNGGSYNFDVVVSGLNPSTKYNFQLTESTTGSSSSVFSETTAATNTNNQSAAPTITSTTSQTATTFTVNYTYTDTPAQATPIYSWLGVKNSTTWIDRSNLLITIPASSTPITQNFSVTYDFTALGLTGNGTQYVYYLANGTTDGATVVSGPAYFTVGTAPIPTFTFAATGQFAGQSPGTYQEGFTVTPSSAPGTDMVLTLSVAKSSDPGTVVSQSSVTMSAGSTSTVSPGTNDLAPGTYIATLLNGTASVGTANFTLTSTVPTFEMEVASLLVPSTTATFKATITATRTDVPNGHLVLKIGTDPNALTLTKVAYDGDIPLAGIGFTIASDPLDPSNNLYYYKFTETTTGTDLSSGSFYINSSSDQSGGPVNSADNNGTCNPTFDTNISQAITASTPNLCSNGTMTNFVATDPNNGPWTWTCAAIAGGGDGDSDTCTATLVAGGGTNPTTPNTQTPATTTTQTPSPADYLENPLSPTLNSFPKIFAAIMNNVVMPVAVIFLPLALIYSGFLFVIARKKGSTDGIEKAKTVFKWTMVGAILILGATVIANALQGTVTQIFGTNSNSQTSMTTNSSSSTTNTALAAATAAINSQVASAAASSKTAATNAAASSASANHSAAASIASNTAATANAVQNSTATNVAVSAATTSLSTKISAFFYSVFH